jgi:hypothetical protein
LLGVTHFMLMNDFYMRADELELVLDEAGMQMLLRGALEYDHEIDYWWNRLDDHNRRWVTLHAIRSENASARARALYRLETLPDSDPPRIPTLVAQTLQVETNDQAKIAAIQVLGTRAQREKLDSSGVYAAMQGTGLTGRLLTTRTRLGVQLDTPKVWRDAVFSPDIDELLAHVALEAPEPAVSELAARTIGRIRSLAAVSKIAEAQRKGSSGALLALALVRDEAPSLPSVVSPRGRLYAWLANTWRRLTDRPMQIVWRYVFALIGGWLAMGYYVWVNLPSEAIFTPDRSGKTISIGLTFGVFVGFLVLLAAELPGRLRGFWPWWTRAGLSAILGVLWGALTYGGFTWFFLNYDPDWRLMLLAGVGLTFGFTLSALFKMRAWFAVLVTALATFIPIWLAAAKQYGPIELAFLNTWLDNQFEFNMPAVIYFREPGDIFLQGIVMVLLIALGGHLATIWRAVRARLEGRLRRA